ncbi:hypothetical protein L208DRAFT_1091067, partial [Tricholoma matsutake]
LKANLNIQYTTGISFPTPNMYYRLMVCNLFFQFGSKGTTVLFSSGDFGGCKLNTGMNRILSVIPFTCPFVTAVSRTVNTNPEVTVDFSGRGFSRYFIQPSYQTQVVKAFLSSLGMKYQGLYEYGYFPQAMTSGRAYPDVTAQSSGSQVVVSGGVLSIGGTNTSSP